MEVGRTKALAHFGGDDVMKILILAIIYIMMECISPQSGRKCVIVASAMRAEQGPCEPIKDCMCIVCIREISEQ